MSWLTEATSPWWSGPAAALLTLGLNQWFTSRNTERQQAENGENRKHAETLAGLQHSAALAQAKADHDARQRSEQDAARLDAATASLDAIAGLRSDLLLFKTSQERIDPSRVDSLLLALGRAQLTLGVYPVEVEGTRQALENLTDHAAQMGNEMAATILDGHLRQMSEHILVAYERE